MLSYMSVTSPEGQTFNGWTFKTAGKNTYLSFTETCNFFNIPEEEAILFVQAPNVRHWDTLTTDPPPPRLFNAETRFINETGLFEIDVNRALNVIWLADAVFKKRLAAAGTIEITRIFDDLKKIFVDSKTPGVGTAFMPIAIINIIYRLAKVGEDIEWIRNFLKDMLSSTYDTLHNIFERYGDRLEEYNASVITLRLLMFLFGTFKLPIGSSSSSTGSGGHSQLVSIIKYTAPQDSPFYALTMKYFLNYTKNRQKTRRPTEKEAMELQYDALNLMTAFSRHVPPSEQLLKFGDEASLCIDNAGLGFKRTLDALSSHTQLFLELANRDYTGYAGIYSKITPHYD